ncbi:MAG: hypothetical protein AB7S86_08230 [Hydrogenophaga sp.]|uniref:hypothetical protein n=1 Tax=Hydrogenophaga sp. TaxID=1904254 RepID=UPI003D125B0B
MQSKVEGAVFSSFAQGRWRFLAGKTTLAGPVPARRLRIARFPLWSAHGFCFNSQQVFPFFFS